MDEVKRLERYKTAIILAIHKTMLESEFKDEYYTNLKDSLSRLNQFDGEQILKDAFAPDYPVDDNDDE